MFWPTAMPGWDRRPWTKDQDLVRTNSTPELFGKSLRDLRQHANKDRVLMIEAWNEWGEGSVLEPSIEHGFAYLEEVRKTFCLDAGPHVDTDPKSLGLRQPIFDLKLPSMSRWTFDFDAQGWTGSGVKDLQTVWGALVMTSENADPKITSPITYLDCAKHPKARIRMRAMPPESGEKTAVGQLFWSTVEFAISANTCLSFAVRLDGTWHEHVIDLSANPKWAGRTDRLRLDPVDKAGIRIEIDEITIE